MECEKFKQVVHVEVCLSSSCVMTSQIEDVKQRVRKVLLTIGKMSSGCCGEATVKDFVGDPSLTSLISSLNITSNSVASSAVQLTQSNRLHGSTDPRGEDKIDRQEHELQHARVGQDIDLTGDNVCFHFYHVNSEGPSSEDMLGCASNDSCGGDEDAGGELSVTSQWILPAAEFQGLWENLIYETDVKSKLLNYVSSTMLFSDKGINSNVITWNRVVLLHGPPGTGKTSLCRALAQKLTILLNSRYSYGHLIEVNSHSLFSKWFSESGKLVLKMFQSIRAIVDNNDALVVLLIDEVESLTHARKSAMAGSDPSDAIRVVNALLTQIDQIRRYPNVIILTTSNMTGAIDLAFVDRADIKQYIGLPSTDAIYQIYESCINELMRGEIISYSRELLLDLRHLKMVDTTQDDWTTRLSRKLLAIAVKSVGFSGRTLRKMPLLAHALFLQRPSVLLEEFLEALDVAVDRQIKDQLEFNTEC